MVSIKGKILNADELKAQYEADNMESKMIDIFTKSSKTYRFSSLDQFIFELNVRSNIIQSSIALNNSRFSFKVFRKSKCNPVFWDRTNEGGFRLKRDVASYDAVSDIYKNSSKYGTECSTAIVIIYYHCLLDIYSKETYSNLFNSIYLMNWQHVGKPLDVRIYKKPEDYIPGDCRYFKNPDVDPLTPEWQGENAIDLGNGTYYGHGMGIRTKDEIIYILNKNRKPGSEISAYLLDSVKNLNYKGLYSYK